MSLLEKSTYQALTRRLGAKRSAKLLIVGAFLTIGCLTGLSLGGTASAAVQDEAMSESASTRCSLRQGTVEPRNMLGLSIDVHHARADSYAVALTNEGPVTVRNVFSMQQGVLRGLIDKVDIGYANRRALETQAWNTDFTVAISPIGVPAHAMSTTICDGKAALIDNDVEGTHFIVKR